MSAPQQQRRPELSEPPASTVVEPAGPLVVNGEVTRVVEVQPYPAALTPLGGCTNFRGVIAYPPAWRQVQPGAEPWGR
jgi:hypothetical protein